LAIQNTVDAMYVANLPKANILNTTISGSSAIVVSQDPVTGKTSATSYDLGITVPQSWVQDKIGTNSVIFSYTKLGSKRSLNFSNILQ